MKWPPAPYCLSPHVSEEPRPKIGIPAVLLKVLFSRTAKKPHRLERLRPQIYIGHSSQCTARGILAFSYELTGKKGQFIYPSGKLSFAPGALELVYLDFRSIMVTTTHKFDRINLDCLRSKRESRPDGSVWTYSILDFFHDGVYIMMGERTG